MSHLLYRSQQCNPARLPLHKAAIEQLQVVGLVLHVASKHDIAILGCPRAVVGVVVVRDEKHLAPRFTDGTPVHNVLPPLGGVEGLVVVGEVVVAPDAKGGKRSESVATPRCGVTVKKVLERNPRAHCAILIMFEAALSTRRCSQQKVRSK
ncbi:hypothetical protein, conserved [Leishmania tarentolae]|uniref:Uncharacterized protein n=1 Tax=Leishmania tarentolae TaxID=5689 RepID=A0A640KQC8_LEITA|nr:hypothetical protein, conserved [Leishmania tarentolae]